MPTLIGTPREGPYSLNMYKKTGIQSNGNTWEAGLAVQRIVLNSLTSGDITPFIGLVGSVYSGEELPLASLLVIPEITVAALLAAVIAVIVVAVTVYVILFLLAHQGPNNQITLYESLGLSHINIPWWEIWAGSGYGEYAELGAYDNAGYYAGYYHSSAYYHPALTTGGLNAYTPQPSPWNPNDGPPWG